MAWEIGFEACYYAKESTRGTAVANPTHRLPYRVTLTPVEEWYEADLSTGHLAQSIKATRVRQWSEFEAEGALDPWHLPLWLETMAKSGVSPTTPSGASTARLWTYVPVMTSDSENGTSNSPLAATLYWGDPNIQMLRAAYCMPDELVITADASSTDGATLSVTGQGRALSKTSPGATPAMLSSIPDLIPGKQQLWIDTSSSIGTTEITDYRLVMSELTLPSGISRKFNGAGPTSSGDFTGVGRGKRQPVAKIRLEVPDTDEYDIWAAGTLAKIRVRINGSLIEAPSASFYNYVEWDIYGYLRDPVWGELEGTNRTVEFTIPGIYDSSLGADYAVRCQSTRTTL